jgi:hypothetical protein
VTLHSIGFGTRDPGFPGAPPRLHRVRAQANFLSPIKLFLPVQSPSAKIFRFPLPPNHLYHARHPVPQRGAFRDRHGRWVRDAVDAGCVLRARDRRADSQESVSGALSTRTRDAASVRPNRVVLTPRRWRQVLWRHVGPTGRGHSIFARRRWQKSPVTGKSTTYAVKTIACGNAGRFRCTRRYSCASTTTKRARGCGCSGHPAFPTPSISRGRKINALARAHRVARVRSRICKQCGC